MTTPTQVGAPIYVFFADSGNVRLFTQNKKQADEFAFNNDQQPVIYTTAGERPVALSTLTDSIDHAHVILRRLGYHRDGDYFINVNRRGAHVATIASIVNAALLAASAPAQQAGQREPELRALFERQDKYGFRRPNRGTYSHERAAPAPEPDWWHAECDDPDYSSFWQLKADAQTEVSTHGGTITALWAHPPASQPVVAEGVTAWQLSERMPLHHRQRTSLENINDVLEVLAALSGTGSEGSEPLPPVALADARKFGAGLDGDSIEQGEPA